MKNEKVLIGSGIVTAIASSLCCIVPLLALIAGGSGAATNLSWIEPFHPYLIGFTILVLGYAWYQKLKPFKSIWISAEVFNLLDINNTVSYLWVADVSGREYAVPNYLTARQLNAKLIFRF
jgi:mercuric ion transport protein